VVCDVVDAGVGAVGAGFEQEASVATITIAAMRIGACEGVRCGRRIRRQLDTKRFREIVVRPRPSAWVGQNRQWPKGLEQIRPRGLLSFLRSCP
jgi:hypothetical protein